MGWPIIFQKEGDSSEKDIDYHMESIDEVMKQLAKTKSPVLGKYLHFNSIGTNSNKIFSIKL